MPARGEPLYGEEQTVLVQRALLPADEQIRVAVAKLLQGQWVAGKEEMCVSAITQRLLRKGDRSELLQLLRGVGETEVLLDVLNPVEVQTEDGAGGVDGDHGKSLRLSPARGREACPGT